MNPFISMLGSVENIKPICTSSLSSVGDGLCPSGVQRLEVLEEDAGDVPKAGRQKGRSGHLQAASDRQPVGDGGERAQRAHAQLAAPRTRISSWRNAKTAQEFGLTTLSCSPPSPTG